MFTNWRLIKCMSISDFSIRYYNLLDLAFSDKTCRHFILKTSFNHHKTLPISSLVNIKIWMRRKKLLNKEKVSRINELQIKTNVTFPSWWIKIIVLHLMKKINLFPLWKLMWLYQYKCYANPTCPLLCQWNSSYKPLHDIYISMCVSSIGLLWVASYTNS